MSTARQRQERDLLLECAQRLESVAGTIEDEKCSHFESESIIWVLGQLGHSLEHINFIIGRKIAEANSKREANLEML